MHRGLDQAPALKAKFGMCPLSLVQGPLFVSQQWLVCFGLCAASAGDKKSAQFVEEIEADEVRAARARETLACERVRIFWWLAADPCGRGHALVPARVCTR